jgi:hypothetical protein
MPSTDAADHTDLGDLGLDEGGHLLIDRGLDRLAAGGRLAVTGRHPALAVHLAAWCRAHGHRLVGPGGNAELPLVVVKGSAGQQRWSERDHVWADIAPKLYAAAAAAQWDPATAVDWTAA